MEKKQKSLGGAFQPQRSGSIFEQFYVIGIPAGAPVDKGPEILFQYPNDKEDESDPPSQQSQGNSTSASVAPLSTSQKTYLPMSIPVSQVIRFCFPRGVDPKLLRQQKSPSEMSNMLYGSVDMEKSSNSFVFIGSNDTTLFYGICVTNDELVERSSSFLNKKNDPSIYNVKNAVVTTTRVYCFISRFPFFKVHYSVLYSILARERLYTVEEAINCTTPTSKDVLPKHKRSASTDSAGQTILVDHIPGSDNEIISILKSYYQLPVPHAGQSLNFRLPNGLISVEFQNPKGDEDKLVANWCLPTAFRVLKLEHILMLISAALLEKPTVIVCNNIGVLSAIVLSIIPLLRPHVWQGPFIPVLPVELQEYLQAPVPFIVGVLQLPKHLEKQIDGFIIKVEQQIETIVLPKEGILPLPRQKKLEAALRPYHTFLHTCTPYRFHDPYKTTEKQIDAVGKIMEEIRKYHEMLLELLNPFIKVPGIEPDQIIQKLTQEYEEKKEREYFKHLVSTQLFNVHLEEMQADLTEEAEQNRILIAQLEEQMRELETRRINALAKAKYYELEANDIQERIAVMKDVKQTLTKGQKKKTQFALRMIASSVEVLKKSLEKKQKQKVAPVTNK